MKKLIRVLTLVLALTLCFSCMAIPVFAEGGSAPLCICEEWCGGTNTECPYCSQYRGCQAEAPKNECVCSNDTCYGNSCDLCKTEDLRKENCPFYKAHPEVPTAWCICKEWCGGANKDCEHCQQAGRCPLSGPEGICICSESGCNMSYCALCADSEWRLANCPAFQTPSFSSAPSFGWTSGKRFTPDVTGHYRTSMAKIIATVIPASVATSLENNELVIDPVTNTVGNLYDSEGNLIPCTLSSDGHFIIVPTNEGYAYIPTGR